MYYVLLSQTCTPNPNTPQFDFSFHSPTISLNLPEYEFSGLINLSAITRRTRIIYTQKHISGAVGYAIHHWQNQGVLEVLFSEVIDRVNPHRYAHVNKGGPLKESLFSWNFQELDSTFQSRDGDIAILEKKSKCELL